MVKDAKKEGKAVARILDARTKVIVGYLYQWNNGAVDSKWNDDIPREDVVYEFL